MSHSFVSQFRDANAVFREVMTAAAETGLLNDTVDYSVRVGREMKRMEKALWVPDDLIHISLHRTEQPDIKLAGRAGVTCEEALRRTLEHLKEDLLTSLSENESEKAA